MSLFLSESEKKAFQAFRKNNVVGQDIFWALLNRVNSRASHPGLTEPEGGSEWWFRAAEYLSDAAMAHALKPSEKVGAWLRDVTLSIVRRSEDDWIGPHFRDHMVKPRQGHLETAHLSWGVAAVLDLAGGIFTETEREEVADVLRNRAIPLCRAWIDAHNHLANWRCVLGAGTAVAAVVLDDAEALERAVADYRLNLESFQADGSYGESLQYSNYAAFNLMLTREALLRRQPDWEDRLPAAPWHLLPRWQAASLFYQKPLGGWGAAPRPRSANFNDSGALFRPSADLLLHIATREKASVPRMAGLARWLFDTLYANDLSLGPHDHATFGFLNHFGFLSIPHLPAAAEALDPEAAGLTKIEAFSCGDVIARDQWHGKTVLATHGGGDSLRGPGHLHGDLNSFILVHNRERLLVDSGHSCYRNLIHGLEGSSHTHNTCTFAINGGEDTGLQEDKANAGILEQSRKARVHFDRETKEIGPLADRGARRIMAATQGEVSVIGSEAAALYGKPIETFSRYWILCGSHALFIVDRIVASRPVATRWHWLLNNRDGELDLKIVPPDRIVARRGNGSMKFFHLGNGKLGTPEHAYVHDAYHPYPQGTGEGRPGSGELLTWQEREAVTERTAVHAIALDSYGPIGSWHLKDEDGKRVLESPGATERCWIDVAPDADTIQIGESVSGRAWRITKGTLENIQSK